MEFARKNIFALTFFLAWMLSLCLAAPIANNSESAIAETQAGYFQGDMILDSFQQQIINGDIPPLMMGRNALRYDMYRWPNHMVPYKIDATFPKEYKDRILLGFAHISENTCIKFSEATNDITGYIYVVPSTSGCSSEVGYRAKPQRINLKMSSPTSGCFTKGSIVHEIMHALGCYHQQSDPERDNYVRIVESNISPGKIYNFDTLPSTLVDNYGVTYDYESLMHYSAYAFSKNGAETIIPLAKNLKKPIGQRKEMSLGDIQKLNTMYNCAAYAK